MADELTIEMFAERLNDTFSVMVDESTAVEMELVEVNDLRERLGSNTGLPRAPFSIVFRGPEAPVYPQQILQFEHNEIGTHAIFVVPIGPGDGGMRYEAVFS